MGASSDDLSRTGLPTQPAGARRTCWAATLCVVLTLLGSAACGDDEKDEPQRDQTGETVDTPTSVEDTRTTLSGSDY